MKSIFKFDEHIQTYKLELEKELLRVEGSGFYDSPYKSIYIDGFRTVGKDDSVINHKHEYIIDLPILNCHERFYLEDKDIFVTIMESVRTSNNCMLYTCYDIYTPKDKDEYERLKEECDKKNKELIKQYEENKPVGAICTPSFPESKEPEKKKGFFARLFSR